MGVQTTRRKHSRFVAALTISALLLVVAVPVRAACTRLDDKYWGTVEECRSKTAVNGYLKTYSKGCHVREATECIAWLDIKNCKNIKRVEEFLKNYSKGPYTPTARWCLRYLESELRFKRLENRYVDKVNSYLEEKRFAAARKAIEILETINPKHPQLEMLKAQMTELKEQLAKRTLRREVENLRAQGKHKEALSLLSKKGKEWAGLRKNIEDELKQITAKVLEVRALLLKGDIASARGVYATARAMGLDAATDRALSAEIEKAVRKEREAALSEYDGFLKDGNTAAARKALERAQALGLQEAAYRARRAAIEEIEKAARDEEIRRLLERCAANDKPRRERETLACYREVQKLDPGNPVAAKMVPDLVIAVAFDKAKEKNTVEAFYGFLQAHGESSLGHAVRKILEEKEALYWDKVLNENTRAAYLRYLEIYSETGVYKRKGVYEKKARELAAQRD